MLDAHRLLEHVLAVVGAAADRVEAAARDRIIVRDEVPGHPHAAADLSTDAFLRDHLLRLEPCGWLSEETPDSADRLARSRVWVVDPIDGTIEFLAGLTEYAVSVALVEHGQPVLGVVAHPPSRRVYHAVRGAGARCDGRALATREASRLLASRTEWSRGEFEPFERDWDVTPSGSIALKLALVAAGAAALTLSRGPKREWDVCAGSLLVREAGGIVTDATGAPLAFNTPAARVYGIIAGAPHAYRRGLEAVTRLRRDLGGG